VKTHIAIMLSKIDATSRTKAVAIARRRGLIEGG
jgi:DNA-binding NarL/FixJ family response regulator